MDSACNSRFIEVVMFRYIGPVSSVHPFKRVLFFFTLSGVSFLKKNIYKFEIFDSYCMDFKCEYISLLVLASSGYTDSLGIKRLSLYSSLHFQHKNA